MRKCIGYSPKDLITISLSLSESQINTFMSQHDTEKYKIVIINMIRAPIDTILSGYNYHLNPPKHELWLKTPLNEMLNNANNILAFRKKRGKPLIDIPQVALHCQSLIMLEMFNSIGLNTVNNTFQDINLTIYNMYHQYNLSIGLHLEYHRYLACEYNNIYNSYKRLKELSSIDDSNIITKNFKLEDFMDTYKRYESEIRDIVETIGINDTMDMNELIDIFRRDKIHKNPKKNNHITSGKYDKQQQINIILSNTDRCYTLRNLTMMLDYKWEYSQYC